MRLIQHERSPKPAHMILSTRPLTVWLTPTTELQIESGDTVQKIALTVARHWPQLGPETVRQVIAYWFALGERVARGDDTPWRKGELRSDPGRVYAPVTKREDEVRSSERPRPSGPARSPRQVKGRR